MIEALKVKRGSYATVAFRRQDGKEEVCMIQRVPPICKSLLSAKHGVLGFGFKGDIEHDLRINQVTAMSPAALCGVPLVGRAVISVGETSASSREGRHRSDKPRPPPPPTNAQPKSLQCRVQNHWLQVGRSVYLVLQTAGRVPNSHLKDG